MKKKQKKPQVIIESHCKAIHDRIERWKNHKERGCSDPIWTDGVNMNLLRNHVMYYKRQIKEICAENNIPLPAEAYTPNLPYVDNNYFAKPDSNRAKRIKSMPNWKCYNHEPTSMEYSDEQLSLL